VDSFQTPFLISNLRIRNSILSVILSEVQNPSLTNGNHTRQMVVIFFRVTQNSSLPVLRVPLRRYNSYNHSPVSDCLCDFNDQFAIIVSPSTTSVWCLKTGQLIMGDISIRSVIGVHVEEQSWSVLSPAPPSRIVGRSSLCLESPKCYIKSFSPTGEIRSTTVLSLPAFSHHRNWCDETLRNVSNSVPFRYDHFSEPYDGRGLVWQQSYQRGWKTKVFTFDSLQCTPVTGLTFYSNGGSCFGDRIFTSFTHEYIIIPHYNVHDSLVSLSYLSLTATRKSSGFSKRPDIPEKGIHVPSETWHNCDMMEYWTSCGTNCHKRYPDTYFWHEDRYVKVQSQDVRAFGDSEFFVIGGGDALYVYNFAGLMEPSGILGENAMGRNRI